MDQDAYITRVIDHLFTSGPSSDLMVGRGGLKGSADVVEFWQAVEYFSPPAIKPPSASNNIRAIEHGAPLPWEPGVLSTPRRGQSWRHTVYAGVFDIAKVSEVLDARLEGSGPKPEPDHGGTRSGSSALMSFAVNDAGRLITDSVALSNCAWAVHRTVTGHDKRDNWFAGFDRAQFDLNCLVSGVGDDLIPVAPALDRPQGKRIAGIAANLAFGAIAGGIAALPALLGSLIGLELSSPASAVLGSVGGGLAQGTTDAVRENIEASPSDKDSDGKDPTGRTPGDDDEALPPSIGTKPLKIMDLAALTGWVARDLGVLDALEPTRVWVQSRQISTRKTDTDSSDFLSTFFADDLAVVASELRGGAISKTSALAQYLTPDRSLDLSQRTDVREVPKVALDALSPDMFPDGGWPGASYERLVTGQQLAINNVMKSLGPPEARGVYAVNGPPGTGKTTMLRELVSAIVVERAKILAKLPSADAAFDVDPVVWTDERTGTSRRIRRPVAALTGHEIVVASSNNSAVENISLDLPGRTAVDVSEFPTADYFGAQAERVLGSPCWGAIAARLGNRKNRRDFVDGLFWNDPSANEHDATDDQDPKVPGLVSALHQMRPDGSPERPSWTEAVKRFESALAEVRRLGAERRTAAYLVRAKNGEMVTPESARSEATTIQTRVTQLEERKDAVSSALSEADAGQRSADAALEAAAAHVSSHAADRPGWWRRLFNRTADSTWRARGSQLRIALDEATAHQKQCHDERDRLVADLAERTTEIRILKSEVWRLTKRAHQIQSMNRSWPGSVPGAEWEQSGPTAASDRETSTPWLDVERSRSRSRLFLAALDLHKAVFTASPRALYPTLKHAMDVVRGADARHEPREAVVAAWQTFFLLVPVVSTTFASVSRMFDRLEHEDLGWLVVDEAGQATPQAVVGALWRSKRAVVVGDPRQLEPVVPLPGPVQTRLRGYFKISETWLPRNTSVQALADRVTPVGTYLPGPEGGELVWVGSPLRVHRRCDGPMFVISNTVGYGGMMVNGVPARAPYSLVKRSMWIDVPATADRWNPLAGDWVASLLDTMSGRAEGDTDKLAESVFVVSPFRAVVQQLESRFPRLAARDRVGTVHVTQGKQADVVILVLGTASTDDGARRWAAQSPNLLNVAASRAKRRFIIIGDYTRWAKLPYFSYVAGLTARPESEFTRLDGSEPPRPSWR